MPERVTEETLREWESLEGCAAGSEWVSKLERMGEKLPGAIVEIRRQQREIAALVTLLKEAKNWALALEREGSFGVNQGWANDVKRWAVEDVEEGIKDLSSAAAEHDRRIRAEGAAEAYAHVVREVRRQMFTTDVDDPRRFGWNSALDAVAKTFQAEARLREGEAK